MSDLLNENPGIILWEINKNVEIIKDRENKQLDLASRHRLKLNCRKFIEKEKKRNPWTERCRGPEA